jgi:hypothetical protein
MGKNLGLMDVQKTYFYLWKQYMMGKRIVTSRYGDGEYLIMKGKKGTIAKHPVIPVLTSKLNEAIKKKGQLICMPTTMFGKTGNVRSVAAEYFVNSSGHSLFGAEIWRIIDVHYSFNLLTEFFIDKTLVVTGNHNECKKAFDSNNIDIDVLPGKKSNAFSEYDKLRAFLEKNASKYENIIFMIGPTANILIADSISFCKSNLIDVGGLFGLILNPYSENENLIKEWTGIPQRSNALRAKRISKIFFKTLKDKLGTMSITSCPCGRRGN